MHTLKTHIAALASTAMLLASSAADATAQTTIDASTFPDADFRSWITANVEGAQDSVLTDEEIGAISELNLTTGKDFTGLATFSSLTHLTIRQKGTAAAAAAIDLGSLASLKRLEIASDNLTSLNVSGCPNIDTLLVNHRQAGKTVSVVGLENLMSPSAIAIRGGNFGTHLDLSALTTIKTLDLRQSTALDTLDLPRTADTIRVDSSQISHLNIEFSPSYSFLSCGSNSLTAFNLRGACVSKLGNVGHQEKTVSATVEDGWVMFDIDKEFKKPDIVNASGQTVSAARVSYEDGYRFGVPIADFRIDSDPTRLIGQTITYDYGINCSCHSDAKMDVKIIIGVVDSSPKPMPVPSEPHWICE